MPEARTSRTLVLHAVHTPRVGGCFRPRLKMTPFAAVPGLMAIRDSFLKRLKKTVSRKQSGSSWGNTHRGSYVLLSCTSSHMNTFWHVSAWSGRSLAGSFADSSTAVGFFTRFVAFSLHHLASWHTCMVKRVNLTTLCSCAEVEHTKVLFLLHPAAPLFGREALTEVGVYT